ncbi:MAG: TlyA family RNA methyltransferase [Eubacteriales bacterium]|nr:TlyA family RNA methyltransferase [Eubacteriales bacterium]
MSDKQRIDTFLHENNYFDSREKARRAIMAGDVLVDGNIVDKAGTKIDVLSSIEVKQKERYVSRGGYKLEKAQEAFSLDLRDKVCMDIGSSTGGFTDCMLQNGARKVYAVDVGYGQLEWKLRNDPRVKVLERTNFRYMDQSLIEDRIDFYSVDVSFISLKLMFPNMAELAADNAEAVTLIKPQFEAGREKVGKHGVVKDRNTHIEVIRNAIAYGADNGFELVDLSFSPIKGAKGNIEYLAFFHYIGIKSAFDCEDKINKVVNLANTELNN